jgi:hypothetical protein
MTASDLALCEVASLICWLPHYPDPSRSLDSFDPFNFFNFPFQFLAIVCRKVSELRLRRFGVCLALSSEEAMLKISFIHRLFLELMNEEYRM